MSNKKKSAKSTKFFEREIQYEGDKRIVTSRIFGRKYMRREDTTKADGTKESTWTFGKNA